MQPFPIITQYNNVPDINDGDATVQDSEQI